MSLNCSWIVDLPPGIDTRLGRIRFILRENESRGITHGTHDRAHRVRYQTLTKEQLLCTIEILCLIHQDEVILWRCTQPIMKTLIDLILLMPWNPSVVVFQSTPWSTWDRSSNIPQSSVSIRFNGPSVSSGGGYPSCRCRSTAPRMVAHCAEFGISEINPSRCRHMECYPT